MYSASRTTQFCVKQQHRHFSVSRSSYSVLDYFKFFKKKNQDNTPQPRDTKEVIKEVEEKQDEIPIEEKIEILGRKNPRYTDKALIKENLKGFQIHRWIPRSNAFTSTLTADNYRSEIGSKLEAIFEEHKLSKEQPIDDLYVRFNVFKTIQKLFILPIPDSKFAVLNSFAAIESYLVAQLDPVLKHSKKTEFQPDAVDLDPAAFEGTNVSISEWTFESQKEKTYKKLMRKANKLEKLSVKEFNEKSSSLPASQ